jgi:hypothetical protein
MDGATNVEAALGLSRRCLHAVGLAAGSHGRTKEMWCALWCDVVCMELNEAAWEVGARRLGPLGARADPWAQPRAGRGSTQHSLHL